METGEPSIHCVCSKEKMAGDQAKIHAHAVATLTMHSKLHNAAVSVGEMESFWSEGAFLQRGRH